MEPQLGISAGTEVILLTNKRKTAHWGSCHSKVWEARVSSGTSKQPFDITAKEGVLRQGKTSSSAGSATAGSKAPRTGCPSSAGRASAVRSGTGGLPGGETHPLATA